MDYCSLTSCVWTRVPDISHTMPGQHSQPNPTSDSVRSFSQLLRFGHEQLRAVNSKLAADWLHRYLRHHIKEMAAQTLFIQETFLAHVHVHVSVMHFSGVLQ